MEKHRLQRNAVRTVNSPSLSRNKKRKSNLKKRLNLRKRRNRRHRKRRSWDHSPPSERPRKLWKRNAMKYYDRRFRNLKPRSKNTNARLKSLKPSNPTWGRSRKSYPLSRKRTPHYARRFGSRISR